MKVTFKHVPLVTALEKLYKIASLRSAQPAQSAFLFTVKKTMTLITAHNLDVVGNIAIFGESDEETIFVLPVEALNVIKAFTVETVDFEIANNILTIYAGFDKITYILTDQMLFTRPAPDYKKDLVTIPINANVLESFERAMAFTMYDEMRPIFSAVVVNVEGELGRIYATSGHIMYKNTFPCPGVANSGNVMIPKQLHAQIRSLKKDDKALLVFSKQWVGIKSSSTGSEFFTRSLEGNAPAYERVIPTDISMTFKLDHKELAKAIKISIAIDNAKTNAVIFSLNGKFDIYRENNEAGAAYRTTMKHEGKLPSEPFVTAFTPDPLSKCIEAIESSAVQFEFTAPTKATLVRTLAEGKPTDEFVLLMPIKAIPDASKKA